MIRLTVGSLPLGHYEGVQEGDPTSRTDHGLLRSVHVDTREAELKPLESSKDQVLLCLWVLHILRHPYLLVLCGLIRAK